MGQKDDAFIGVGRRSASSEFPRLLAGIEAHGHRMGEGDDIAKLPVCQVIEVEQINLNPFLKVFL